MPLSPGVAASVPGGASAGSAIRDSVAANMRRGASWFLVIALLSGINSVLQALKVNLHFVFGLGVTQVVDAVTAHNVQTGRMPMLAINGAFLVLLLLCGKFAREGSQGAFLGGMILYALDGALLLYYAVWIDSAVHAYALFRLWQGYAACRELVEFDRAASPGMPRPA